MKERNNLPASVINEYFNDLIGKTYKILIIYEGCEEARDYYNYITYLERFSVQIKGGYTLFSDITLLTIESLLYGLMDIDMINHKKVKNITFHCIELIKKELVFDEDGE